MVHSFLVIDSGTLEPYEGSWITWRTTNVLNLLGLNTTEREKQQLRENISKLFNGWEILLKLEKRLSRIPQNLLIGAQEMGMIDTIE